MVSSYLAVAQSLGSFGSCGCLDIARYRLRFRSLSRHPTSPINGSRTFALAQRNRYGASHSILLFCGTVLTLTGTWVSQANLLFRLPGLSSPVLTKNISSKFARHRVRLRACRLLIAVVVALRTPMPSSSLTKNIGSMFARLRRNY